jgi:hypothetical protein
MLVSPWPQLFSFRLPVKVCVLRPDLMALNLSEGSARTRVVPKEADAGDTDAVLEGARMGLSETRGTRLELVLEVSWVTAAPRTPAQTELRPLPESWSD